MLKTKLSIKEVNQEYAEVLPQRKELSLLNLAAPVNAAVAVNALNIGSSGGAAAIAQQCNWIFQK
ncbi:MAG: hypothetical protein ACREHC_00420 [Candidatus Levyibacteriota bacterium]